MKKLLIVLCLGMIVSGMAACGNKENGNEGQEGNVTSEVQNTADQSTVDQSAAADEQGQDNIIDVSEGWSQEMQQIRDEVAEGLGDNYWPDTAIMPELLESNYGITQDLYTDYMGEIPMIGTNVDTLLIIRAKDDKVEEVEEALTAYRENLVNDTMQYPMNVGKIQASRIERIGNYVCFVQLGADTMDVMDLGDEEVIIHCQEQNELALKIIRRSIPNE